MTRPLRIALLIVGVLLAGTARGRAAEEDDDKPDAGRVSVAIFVVADGKLSAGVHASIVRGLERGLKANERISAKETDLLLAQFSGDVPLESIAEARALLQAGAELVSQGKPDLAVKKLEPAVRALENVLGYVRKNELAEGQFLLGVAFLGAGDREAAEQVFERLQTWRPGYVVDVEKYPNVLPVWEKVRARVEGRGRGSVEVRSTPPGAMAFVDGKYVGVTPTRSEALLVGDHYVTLKKEGYQRRVVKVTIDDKVEQSIKESLPRSEKYLLLSQSLERARPDLGGRNASPAMRDLKTFLFIDQAIFVVPRRDDKKLVLDAYLYDLRSKRRLSAVEGVKLQGDFDDELADTAKALYAGVRYDGKTEEDDRLARAAEGRRRAPEGGLTSRWWFWTIVGVGLGVAVPFTLYEAGVFDGPPAGACPDGDVCGQVLLRY